MSRRRPRVGDVIQVTLPSGRYAYGRVLRDASVAFYAGTTAESGLPPIGSRDYQFVVGVYDDVPGSDGTPVVGHGVDVLLRIYAKCVVGQDELARRRISEALRQE